ncbi:MAG: hypothetical protein IJS00_00310 [Paludibacteraceae bacterium]|nr:hypothetical protein [Paludibacteraceae bacterium]
MKYIRHILSIILLLGAECVSAQKLLYDADFLLNFDNREINHQYEPSGTVFGFRLTPSIGVLINDSSDGTHRLMAGVSYLQPCGADWRHVKVYPMVYYHYQWRGFEMHTGFVPYAELRQPLPEYLRSDSLAFAYPNVQGALFQYSSKHGYVMALCDWRGMMSRDTREAFRIVGGGRYQYQWFYTGGYLQMNHLSHNADTITGVCDDIVLNPLVGANIGQYTPLDSLSVQVGYISGLQRDRKARNTYWCHGMQADIALVWRFIGFRNLTYFGQNQMPLYKEYGQLLNQGEPRYQSTFINRSDLYFYIVRRSFVTCFAGWSLIVTDHGKISNQQQVVCRFNLHSALHNRRKETIKTLNWR